MQLELGCAGGLLLGIIGICMHAARVSQLNDGDDDRKVGAGNEDGDADGTRAESEVDADAGCTVGLMLSLTWFC